MHRLFASFAAAALLLLGHQARGASPAAAAPPAVEPAPSGQLKANGVELAYVEQGSGAPVVFVHGALGDWRTFEVVRPAISAHHRYVAYSRRYHYPNPWPGDGSDYSFQLHEADLVALIEALGAGPVHLVGSSYGAGVVLLAAIDHPELVRSAVLAEPGSLFPELIAGRPGGAALLAARAAEVREMREAARAGDLERSAALLVDSVSGAPGTFGKLPGQRRRRLMDNVRTMGPLLLQRPPPTLTCAAIGAIHVPVLVVRGEKTTPFYAATTDALVRCLPPGISQAVIPNAGHVQYVANPKAFTDAVLGFIELHP